MTDQEALESRDSVEPEERERPADERRFAVVRAASRAEVEAYLPGCYEVVFDGSPTPDGRRGFVIAGEDVAGWTLDGYVIPRLGTGVLFTREHPTLEDATRAASAGAN